MAFTPLHATIGIAIVKIIPNPLISIPLAFFSHIFADLYPEWNHKVSGIKSRWDFKNYTWKEFSLIVTQCIFVCFILIYLIDQRSLILFIGAIIANLMDVWDS